MSDKPRLRVKAGQTLFTADSFQNFAANLGIGTNNLTTAGGYGLNPITRQRVPLSWMYRGSWIVRQVVRAVADDMTRAGVQVNSDMPPPDLEALETAFKNWGIWKCLNDAIKWGRLYGGAVAMINIDGQRPDTPLRRNTIRKGQFLGLTVFDRWQLQSDMNNLVSKPGPSFGLPEYYRLTVYGNTAPDLRIHHSRLIRFDGDDLPYWDRLTENSWGLSVVEPMYDRIMAFDSTTTGIAQLVYKAHLRTLSVGGLREVLAAGGAMKQGLLAQVDFMRQTQSSEGITLIDAEDKMEHFNQTFSGLDSVLIQFGQQISGACQIPLVRLFGQSPSGLNSTGDSDIRLYYDGIRAQQENKLDLPLQKLYDIAHRSLFGRPLDPSFSFEFTPLWQMDETQKAELADKAGEAIGKQFDRSVISEQVVLKELRALSKITGIFTNITDEDIAAADDKPPEPETEGPPMLGPDGMPIPGAPPGMPGAAPDDGQEGDDDPGADDPPPAGKPPAPARRIAKTGPDAPKPEPKKEAA